MVKIEDHEYLCTEERRLRQDTLREKYWKKWGPYVAERQWATGACSFAYNTFKNSPKGLENHNSNIAQYERITALTATHGVVSFIL
jgi:hypothetical protein